MGYLINTGILEYSVTIPEATVQTMDGNSPYTLIQNSTKFICPIYCYISLSNSSTAYSLFSHLHLTNTGQYYSTFLCATLNENALSSGIQKGEVYGMLINIQQSATFGGIIYNNNLEIFFDTVPTSGDGDMNVKLGYIYF
jgi:hypothetical protein